MKAKEIAEEIVSEMRQPLSVRKGSTAETMALAKKIAQYAKQKCKEQRSLCAQHCGDDYYYSNINAAPEPEFD